MTKTLFAYALLSIVASASAEEPETELYLASKTEYRNAVKVTESVDGKTVTIYVWKEPLCTAADINKATITIASISHLSLQFREESRHRIVDQLANIPHDGFVKKAHGHWQYCGLPIYFYYRSESNSLDVQSPGPNLLKPMCDGLAQPEYFPK